MDAPEAFVFENKFVLKDVSGCYLGPIILPFASIEI